jgi:hypothetical protein
MRLTNIFNKPKMLPSIGQVYPVLMKDYDDFMECSNVLSLSYQHFDIREVAKLLESDEGEIKLLDLVILAARESNTFDETMETLNQVFSIVLKQKIVHDFGEFGIYFRDEKNNYLIDRFNYDEVRSTIMHQNIIFEPKIFKDKLVAQWAEMALKQRAKNSVDISIEDMLTTISVVSGKHYWDLENYSIYQIKQEFARIGKDKTYHTNVAFKCAGAESVDIEHYAENTEIYKSPFDDLFKKKNQNSGLNKAMK